jgi:hypothetical protein
MSEDIKTFVNPASGPHHQGAFSIELVEGAKTAHVPRSATVSGNIVHVPQGSVQQVMGGIQLHSETFPFGWGYNFIKYIRKGDGSLLWVNNKYR